MKKFTSYISEASIAKNSVPKTKSKLVIVNPCDKKTGIVWAGMLQATPLYNISNNTIWKGATQGTPVCNIQGDILWKGLTQTVALGNFKSGVLWKGITQEEPLFNIKNNIIWKSNTQTIVIYNYSTAILTPKGKDCVLANIVAWKGMTKAAPVYNSNQYLTTKQKLALTYLIRSVPAKPKIVIPVVKSPVVEFVNSLEEKRVRDYAKEYREYQGLPAQLKKQSDCHKARRLMGLKTHDPREVDHIIPTSKGGTNETKNLRIVSRAENRKKSNKLMKDLEEE